MNSSKGLKVPASIPETGSVEEWREFVADIKRLRGKDMAPSDYDDLLKALVQELQEESTRLDARVLELEAMADKVARRVPGDGRDHSE